MSLSPEVTALQQIDEQLKATVADILAVIDRRVAQLSRTPMSRALAPFDDDSLWNIYPTVKALDAPAIPVSPSGWAPFIGEGDFSTGVYIGTANDPPLTLQAQLPAWIWNTATHNASPTFTIPHCPANVSPAPGSDGHCDVIDLTTGIVYSMTEMRDLGRGQFSAKLVSQQSIYGPGWATPANPLNGPRAARVVAMAGLIRAHEIDDGTEYYAHALASSLAFEGLAADPAFVPPATAADSGADANLGTIPEGARLFLPDDFDLSQITIPAIQKVVRTLQRFGTYVVDRNYGTSFVIYVERGSGFTLHPGGWNVRAAYELDLIRAGLRRASSMSAWVDRLARPVLQDASGEPLA